MDHSTFSFTRISFDFCCVGALAVMLMWQSVGGENLAFIDLYVQSCVSPLQSPWMQRVKVMLPLSLWPPPPRPFRQLPQPTAPPPPTSHSPSRSLRRRIGGKPNQGCIRAKLLHHPKHVLRSDHRYCLHVISLWRRRVENTRGYHLGKGLRLPFKLS